MLFGEEKRCLFILHQNPLGSPGPSSVTTYKFPSWLLQPVCTRGRTAPTPWKIYSLHTYTPAELQDTKLCTHTSAEYTYGAATFSPSPPG
ncbi:hypothetical protein FKM82_029719 [Ascaphus truei]